ncbi:MAG: type II secretion system protein GspL [Gammaproteobacteria bacterium]|nr:type II secretion system protein GspL [Gammaproteobacteria bacterium]MBV9620134.1 type II secretion system protein GspL [Gammaproteobacteria bacterium]
MAESLLLRLPREAGQPATWLVADARGAPAGPPQSGPLSLAAPRSAGRRVIVLVPGTDVLLAEPEIPARAGAKIQQLIPYALEEHLAEDIDALHFAIAKRAPDSARARVAVVTRALLDEWLAQLRAAGIEPDALYAESDLLPENPGQAVALLEHDAVFVRPPGGSVTALPADALDQALEIARSGSEGGARALILYTGAAEWQQYGPQVEAVRPHFDGIKIQLLTGGPLALFAQQLPLGAAINVLQGEYAPKHNRAVGWEAWRVAALLLLGLVCLHVVGKAAQLHLLKNREHQVEASMREVFRSALPGEVPPADPKQRMQERLARARGAGSGLLPALQALAEARDASPGTAVQSLNFHNGALELTLTAPDAASLDKLSQALRSRGWQADLTGGNNTAGGYQGRLALHGGST